MTNTRNIFGKTALVLAAAATLTGVATSPAVATGGPKVDDALQREVAQHVLEAGPPGYLARIDNGRQVYTLARGVADKKTGRPIKATDQFEAGSNTKTFTSTLVLQQVDHGRISLDAPVEKYLPGVVPNGRNITVRRLLNHTSGLFSYTGDENFFTDLTKNPQHVSTDAELLKIAFKHKPYFAPGKGWQYSNTNYTLLGMILEKQTGKSMATLVRERIAEPLGLEDTYYADPRATDTGEGFAHGYAIAFASGKPVHTDSSSWPIGGWGGAAGAIITTADDLSTFFSGLMQGKLFSAAMLEQMKTTVPLPATYPIKGGYGLGLFKTDSPCGTVWGHGGDTMGHHSTAVVTEDGRRTAVTDSTGEPLEATENAGVKRYYETLVFGADVVTTCQMLGKPAPAEVLTSLRGK